MNDLNDYNEQLFSATYAYVLARRLYLTVRDDAGKDSVSAKAAAEQLRVVGRYAVAEVLEDAFAAELS